MSNIKDKIREGYCSLAGRTLELYEDLSRQISIFQPEDIRRVNQFEDNLKKVRDSGDIKSIGKTGRRNLHDIMDMFGKAIPYDSKPISVQGSFDLASTSIMAYFGIPDGDELIKRARINSFVPSTDSSGILMRGHSENDIERILIVLFDPRRPAHSVIVNVHELYHSLQPEYQEINEIGIGKTKIGGYDRLMKAINADRALSQRRVDIAIASHELNFFNLPEVIEIAKKEKVDIEQLEVYLRNNVPRMNFLTCYTEGDAYITQRDVIARNPDLQRHKVPLQAYELMALTAALLAPFLKPKEKVYEVGVGLFEHIRNHPNVRETLKNSREFHQELSDTYFRCPSH